MSEKDLNVLIQLALDKLEIGISKEGALNSFVAAGIMDIDGEYTEPYKELEHLASK